ncbi:hypothetical protein ACWD5R_17885 [Streptomyces sp. NPDC002514]|uniref:hypothetical protein n=1 Tax=Streptomyces sp. NPDC001270 TaxID=3364554 RepID=UPI0036A7F449
MTATGTSLSVQTPFGTPQERRAAAEAWLHRSATTVIDDDWAHDVVLLTAGIAWDAVRLPYTVLDPDADVGTPPDAMRVTLKRLRLAGPVFCDPYRDCLYVMVPPGTDRGWPSRLVDAGVECLGRNGRLGHYVGVPVLDRTEPPGPYWLAAPDVVAFRYVDPHRLRQVLDDRSARDQS